MQERVELVGICSRLLRKVAVDTWNLAIASLDHDPSRLEDRRQNHGKGPNSIAGRSDATNDSLAEPDISDERQGSGTRTSDEIDSEDDSKLLTGKAGQESKLVGLRAQRGHEEETKMGGGGWGGEEASAGKVGIACLRLMQTVLVSGRFRQAPRDGEERLAKELGRTARGADRAGGEGDEQVEVLEKIRVEGSMGVVMAVAMMVGAEEARGDVSVTWKEEDDKDGAARRQDEKEGVMDRRTRRRMRSAAACVAGRVMLGLVEEEEAKDLLLPWTQGRP